MSITEDGRELTYKPVHPGQVLLGELTERKIKHEDFADEIGVYPSYLSELLHGKKRIVPRTAIALQKALKISALYWMRLQAAYDLYDYEKRNKD